MKMKTIHLKHITAFFLSDNPTRIVYKTRFVESSSETLIDKKLRISHVIQNNQGEWKAY